MASIQKNSGTHAAIKATPKPIVKASAQTVKSGPAKNAETGFTAKSSFATTTAKTTANAKATVGEVPKPAPSTMSESEKFDYYSKIATDAKGTVSKLPGEKTLVGIRAPTDPKHRQGVYDDTLAMLWTDKKGGKHVAEYTYNTEPTPQYNNGKTGFDANGDGQKDIARLPAGTYEYRIGKSPTFGTSLMPTKKVMVDRDVNHDGYFDDGVKNSAGTSILFHAGTTASPGNMGAVTMSEGCQTLPPREFDRMMSDLLRDGGSGKKISYTLVTGESAD